MTEGPQALVALENVSKTYSGIRVLTSAQVEIRSGEVLALVGENGAGKSTLMKILAGAERPDAGAAMTYFGEVYDAVTPQQTLEWGVSVIYQDLSLFPNLSVAENLAFSRARQGGVAYAPRRWRSEAVELLDRLGLAFDPDALVETLSFGQRQMIAIARAVASDVRVIIMDEPTSALSAVEVEILYGIVDQLRAAGVGIVFISHKFDEVFRVADRVTVLRDGQVIVTGPIADFTEDDLITAMVGRKTEYDATRVDGEPGAVVLNVTDLQVDGIAQPVSFSARANEVVAITGLVGSGRTELAHTLFGITPAVRGAIEVDGVAVSIGSPAQAVAHGIGYVPEDRRLQGIFAGHTLSTNVALSAFDRLLDPLRRIDPKRESALVARAIKDLDIRPALPEADAGTLSGGNQQKVLLARWMAATPRVLIVDEPTNGIDVGAKREIHKLLQSLAASGTAVVVISSELPEVLAIANRILVMRHGQIVAETTPEDSTQESILALELHGGTQ